MGQSGHRGVGGDITQLLERWRDGDPASRDEVCERLYDLLRQMAYARIGGGRHGSTLQPTVLVHDALLRMIGGEARYLDRAHFLSLAALKMRAVLVDHARMKAAAKRGGGAVDLALSHADAVEGGESDQVDVLALHQALEQLAERDQRAAQVVEKAYFGGMSHAEIAEVLAVSVPTVERDMRFAKAWLNRALSG